MWVWFQSLIQFVHMRSPSFKILRKMTKSEMVPNFGTTVYLVMKYIGLCMCRHRFGSGHRGVAMPDFDPEAC